MVNNFDTISINKFFFRKYRKKLKLKRDLMCLKLLDNTTANTHKSKKSITILNKKLSRKEKKEIKNIIKNNYNFKKAKSFVEIQSIYKRFLKGLNQAELHNMDNILNKNKEFLEVFNLNEILNPVFTLSGIALAIFALFETDYLNLIAFIGASGFIFILIISVIIFSNAYRTQVIINKFKLSCLEEVKKESSLAEKIVSVSNEEIGNITKKIIDEEKLNTDLDCCIKGALESITERRLDKLGDDFINKTVEEKVLKLLTENRNR